MAIGLITFNGAYGEYVRCHPNAMEKVLAAVGRADTDGVDMKRYAAKPESFMAVCLIFGYGTAGEVISRVAAWQGQQGEEGTLGLPYGYVANVVLQHVRKLNDIQQWRGATNGSTHYQTLALTFVQRLPAT